MNPILVVISNTIKPGVIFTPIGGYFHPHEGLILLLLLLLLAILLYATVLIMAPYSFMTFFDSD